MYCFSLFRYGHEAVLFFFVLSGFVIHLRYARRMAEQGVRFIELIDRHVPYLARKAEIIEEYLQHR